MERCPHTGRVKPNCCCRACTAHLLAQHRKPTPSVQWLEALKVKAAGRIV
jgi:hypothetical protein